VVALQHRVETADEQVVDDDVSLTSARADVERLEAGLSRALLAASADDIRRLAKRASDALAVVERRRERAGERPDLDPAADAAVRAAVARYRAACAARSTIGETRQRLLARGNAAAVTSLGAAGLLVAAGVAPMALPVAFFVVASTVGPATATAMAATRRTDAQRAVAAAREAWVEALEQAGVATMGALSARRLAVRAWERHNAEVALAEEAAAPHLRAWHRVAGPGVDPADVEAVLAQVAALRAAQLRLLAVHLSQRAAEPEPEAVVVLEPVVDVRPASWFDDALERIRGRRFSLGT
jgi:hypothetical protein